MSLGSCPPCLPSLSLSPCFPLPLCFYAISYSHLTCSETPSSLHSAVASVLDKGFESVSSQLKAGIPESGSLQMAKLVPIMSNEFGCVAGPGDWGGYQALRVCDGSSCRALFQVVGLGASAN